MLLGVSIAPAFATNFYTVIENKTEYVLADIWTKNSLHWDNRGWCDSVGDRLYVGPGNVKVYCGGTSAGSKTWSDTPRVQHEWWFGDERSDGGKVVQDYSEQWMTYYNGNASAWDEYYEITRFAIKNNFDALEVEYPSNSRDMIAKYTIINSTTMVLNSYVCGRIDNLDYNLLKKADYDYSKCDNEVIDKAIPIRTGY